MIQPYPGTEETWKKCQRCGRYYEIGITNSEENCLTIARAIAKDLGLRDYKYLVVSGYRRVDYTTFGCCGKHTKKGTRVAWYHRQYADVEGLSIGMAG